MEQVADLADVVTLGTDLDHLLDFGDGREIEVPAAALGKEVAGEIADVKTLHHHDDRALLFVVEPRQQRISAPLNQSLACGVGHRLLGFDRIVNNDEIAAAPR